MEKPGILGGGIVEEIMVNQWLSTDFVENAVDDWWSGVHTLWSLFDVAINGGNPVENYTPVIHADIAH